MGEINKIEMDGLLETVSKKLGMPKEQLKKELESGKFDNALNSMKPAEAKMFNNIVKNPATLDKFMTTPQVKALYEKLTK
jgi:hypothetical protein